MSITHTLLSFSPALTLTRLAMHVLQAQDQVFFRIFSLHNSIWVLNAFFYALNSFRCCSYDTVQLMRRAAAECAHKSFVSEIYKFVFTNTCIKCIVRVINIDKRFYENNLFFSIWVQSHIYMYKTYFYEAKEYNIVVR